MTVFDEANRFFGRCRYFFSIVWRVYGDDQNGQPVRMDAHDSWYLANLHYPTRSAEARREAGL